MDLKRMAGLAVFAAAFSAPTETRSVHRANRQRKVDRRKRVQRVIARKSRRYNLRNRK